MTAHALRPTVPEVLPLVRALYLRHSAGCCLHIVLDDENVKDSHVEHCRLSAVREGHQDCIDLAALLARMSKTQRLKLARMVIRFLPG